MTYVWLSENGRHRYVDDQWLNPCRTCGKRISVCRENNCLELEVIEAPEDNGCGVCQSDRGCQCDSMYEAYKESQLD
jgi:hypothetical protein